MKLLKRIWKWIRKDGLLHIVLSALIYLAVFSITFYWIKMPVVSSHVLTFAVAALVGIFKEMYDYITKKGVASLHDLICNMIGIVFMMLLLIIVV